MTSESAYSQSICLIMSHPFIEATKLKSEFNSKTVGTKFRQGGSAFVVDYDRRWRSSRSRIVCANGTNDRLNGAVRGSLRGLTSVRLYGWPSFKFRCDWLVT